MTEYAGHASALVADVDCTADGKDLCSVHGVQGFPTIKWGSPDAMEDYEGGRDLESLTAFAAENLKPVCGPENIDLCDDDKKALIKQLQSEGVAKLTGKIAEKTTELETAETDFEAAVEKLQAEYEALSEAKDAKAKEIKDSGLGLMKAVLASLSKAESAEL